MKNTSSENNKESNNHLEELSAYTIELNEKIKSANSHIEDFSHQYYYECGSLKFILPHAQSAEVIKYPEMSAIPTTPLWFRGMASVRGNLFPVFDINALVLKNDFTNFEWLLVYGREKKMAGLCINSLPLNINNHKEIDPDPTQLPEMLKPYINKTYKLNECVYFEPDYKKLFNIFYENF